MPHSTVSETTTAVKETKVEFFPLETVDYGRLVKKDSAEVEKLLQASRMPGFFYLDLRNEPKTFMSDLEEVYGFSKEHFDERTEDGGSKPAQRQIMFEMTQDAIKSNSVSYPSALKPHSQQLEAFSTLCHDVNSTMLSCLSDSLSLSGRDRFETYHSPSQTSESAFNLIYAPTKPLKVDHPDTTHTDSGTLTILFSNEWGIMIEHPETKKWSWVEPRPGFALANVADFLAEKSEGALYSCRHRIDQPADGFEGRYFAVSYLRPAKTG